MADIEIGKIAQNITVFLVAGDVFTATLRRSQDGFEVAWPQAPVLVLGDLSFTMTLSVDNHVAAITIPAATVDEIAAGTSRKAELHIGETETWRGKFKVT